jgi:hypothetical protein
MIQGGYNSGCCVWGLGGLTDELGVTMIHGDTSGKDGGVAQLEADCGILGEWWGFTITSVLYMKGICGV